MRSALTGRRLSLSGWGRFLLSLTLALFMLGPSLCAYACAADGVPPAASASATSPAAVQASSPAEHDGGKAGLCPHGGHCHHSPFADLSGGALDVRSAVHANVDREAWTSLVPDSLNPDGPERPPRA